MKKTRRARFFSLAAVAGLAGLGGLVLAGSSSTSFEFLPWHRTSLTIASEPTVCTGHVRLTFDDGPHPEFTPRILDALDRSGATATFFAKGQLVEAHPEVASRIVADGHGIQNHTWDHPYLTTLPPDEVDSQLTRTNSAIQKATGKTPTQWRPPYEDYNPDTETRATSLDLETVLWDYETDTNDWRGASPDEIRDVVLDNATDGSIVLMHDRIENTATAVPMILDGLHQKGLCTR